MTNRERLKSLVEKIMSGVCVSSVDCDKCKYDDGIGSSWAMEACYIDAAVDYLIQNDVTFKKKRSENEDEDEVK